MFERQLKKLSWVCALWLSGMTTSYVVAQSNQPIEISSPDAIQPARTPHPELSKPDTRGDERLTRLAKRLGTTQQPPSTPTPPELPESPELPSRPLLSKAKPLVNTIPDAQNESRSLGNGQDQDQSSVTLDDPIERSALGIPKLGPQDEAIPAPPEQNRSGWILNTVTALGVVLVLIYLVRAGLARLTGHTPAVANTEVLEVLTRVSVAPRNHVLLIRMGRRILAVGDSSAGLRTLANIEDPEEVADLLAATMAAKPSSITKGFNQLFNRFNSDYTDEIRRVEEGGDTSENRVDRARDQVSSLLSRVRTMANRGDVA